MKEEIERERERSRGEVYTDLCISLDPSPYN